MLYVSTRNKVDAFTAQRVLCDGRAPDGGLFAPFRLPRFSELEVMCLGQKTFNVCVADALNLLFNTHLTGYDLDLCPGRQPVRLKQLNNRLLLAECWHNLHWQYSRMEELLLGQISQTGAERVVNGSWASVGIRMAVMLGIFGQLIRRGLAGEGKTVDISVVSGDFSGAMAAWYLRQMGVPVGNIICCCNENGNLWDFICHGQLRTEGSAVATAIPEGDVVYPLGLERLIHACAGADAVCRFAETVHQGRSYYVEERFLRELRQGIYVTVSTQQRVLSAIATIYATHGCLLSAHTALAYVGLQDYRARTGESRTALVFSEKSPRADIPTVAAAMGISCEDLERFL